MNKTHVLRILLSSIVLAGAFSACSKNSKNSGSGKAVTCSSLNNSSACGSQDSCMWDPNSSQCTTYSDKGYGCESYRDVNACGQSQNLNRCSWINNKCRAIIPPTTSLNTTDPYNCAQYNSVANPSVSCNANTNCQYVGSTCTPKTVNCNGLIQTTCSVTTGCYYSVGNARCEVNCQLQTPTTCANNAVCAYTSGVCSNRVR